LSFSETPADHDPAQTSEDPVRDKADRRSQSQREDVTVSTPPVSLLFEAAHVIVGDGKTTIEDAGILVRDGLIVEIAPLASFDAAAEFERVDLHGKTVMPTIVNPHGHIGYLTGGVTSRENFSRENVLDHLHRLAYYGVSVFQSLGTDRDDVEITLRNEQRAGADLEPGLALLFSAANGLVAPTPGSENGGPYFATDVIREVTTPDEARATVREISAKKPDAIKFWVDDRWGTKAKFGPEIYTAIIDEGHQRGHTVIAHIFDLDDAKGVVRAGVDGIAHMVREPGPDPEFIELLKQNDVFAFTSMGIQKGLPEGTAWLDDPAIAETVSAEGLATIRTQIESVPADRLAGMKASYEILEASLRTYAENDVRFVLSADTGLFTQFFGIAEHRELEAMVQAGVSAQRAIRASTLIPAQILGLADRGSLEPGKRADLLVLDGNPLDDIANTRRISAVYFAGQALDRAALRSRWTPSRNGSCS